MVGLRLSLIAGCLFVACSSSPNMATPTTREPAVAISAVSPTPDLWSDLRRPLSAVSLAAGGACPFSRGRDASEVPGARGFTSGVRGYVAFGMGPVHPAFVAEADEAVLVFSKMPKDRGRAIEKVIWIVEPAYAGPLLVRAVSSDGAYRVAFMSGEELTIEVSEGGGTFPEGLVYFPAPGCYTFQVDGTDLAERVVVLV